MASDELTPFLSAEGHLIEAAGWLEDALKPVGHPDRLEQDDAACMEQAAHEISRAAQCLLEFGADNWHTPEACVGDQEAVDAAQLIKSQFGSIGLPACGRSNPVVDAAVVNQMKSFIRANYGARLERDKAFANALADSYDM